jgi:AraC-like DNA-binding protein
LNYQLQKLEKLAGFVKQFTPQEGINFAPIRNLGTYRSSTTQSREPEIDIPAIVIVVQGMKVCYLGDQTHVYQAGKVLVGFYPIPVETEILEASPGEPYLAVGVSIDMSRMADLLLRIDQVEETAPKPAVTDPSAKFTTELNDQLLDPFIRLFETLEDPKDAAILGEAIIDEIYYRLLNGERGSELRALLQQRGKIKRISKVVDYIHNNMDQPVSVKKLADIVHMSESTFYMNFKDVMQVTPLQYAKSVKLFEAQRLIKEGKRVNEASYLVGYNNLGQFSREYKRHFGFVPSAT